MGKKIRVTPEELGAASQKLAGLADDYKEIFKKLMQEAGTMGEAWEGQDNLAFVAQINGFCQELEMMAQKILKASEALEKQRVNYVTRQEANITEVKKLIN